MHWEAVGGGRGSLFELPGSSDSLIISWRCDAMTLYYDEGAGRMHFLLWHIMKCRDDSMGSM